MFVHFLGKLVNADTIRWVDYSNLVEKDYIRVCNKANEIFLVEGPQAFDVVMRLCPEALEGEQAQYERHAWAVHNLVGHPLMQLCSWLGLAPLGLKIHDLNSRKPTALGMRHKKNN